MNAVEIHPIELGSPTQALQCPESSPLILVVDDSKANRLMLECLLSGFGYQVALAENGVAALERCRERLPDLVMLDVVMPGMDGYEVAGAIRELSGTAYIPIIFITALGATEDVARCFSAGGDAVFSRPFNPVILKAQILSMLKTQAMYVALNRHRDELIQHEERMSREFDEIHELLGQLARTRNVWPPNCRVVHQPAAVVNGDVLLAGWGPGGTQQILIGDLTGHGVPAAVGAVLVAEVFRAMNRRGFSGAEILSELNRKLAEVLPSGRFMAAGFIELSRDLRLATIWNAGLPDILIARADGSVERFTSRTVPLGILESDGFELEADYAVLEPDTRILAFTDGITELAGYGGEFFGIERVVECVREALGKQGNLVEALLTAQSAFQLDAAPADDVSLVEVRCDPALLVDYWSRKVEDTPETRPGAWRASIEVTPEALRRVEPVPVVVQMIADMEGSRCDRGRAFTVLAELFSNALEHGVLHLDSSMKKGPEGFAEYYRERERRLSELDHAKLRIDMQSEPHEGHSRMQLTISHTGDGFDFSGVLQQSEQAQYGRGLSLVKALTQDLSFEDEGRTVKAVCYW